MINYTNKLQRNEEAKGKTSEQKSFGLIDLDCNQDNKQENKQRKKKLRGRNCLYPPSPRL
jgi:hypothetical protein